MPYHSNIPAIEKEANDPVKITGVLVAKSTLLGQLVKQPDLCSKIGSAWQLFFYLVYVVCGKMTGTRDDIGAMFGIGGRTLDNWLKGLESNGIINKQHVHREIEITLTDDYMKIALAPDVIVEERLAELPPDSPRLQMMRKMVDATEIAGTKIEVKIVI